MKGRGGVKKRIKKERKEEEFEWTEHAEKYEHPNPNFPFPVARLQCRVGENRLADSGHSLEKMKEPCRQCSAFIIDLFRAECYL